MEATPFLFKHDIKVITEGGACMHKKHSTTRLSLTPQPNRDPQVEGTIPPALAAAALAQWEKEFKGKQAPPEPSSSSSSAAGERENGRARACVASPSYLSKRTTGLKTIRTFLSHTHAHAHSHTTTESEVPPFAPDAAQRARQLAADSRALMVVKVILASGATVRDGVEIDVAEQVRNLPHVRKQRKQLKRQTRKARVG